MARSQIRTLVLAGLLLMGSGTTYLPAQAPPAAAEDTVLGMLDGNTVRIPSAGMSFQIPAQWADMYRSSKKNLQLTRKALDRANTSQQEWELEYQHVLGAMFPFESCLTQVGAEGWGPDAVSYADVQARVYLVDATPEEIGQRAKAEGLQEVRKLKRLVGDTGRGAPPVSVTVEEVKGWSRALLNFRLRFGDYGAVANVEMYSRRHVDKTAVVVFMSTQHPRTDKQSITDILESFQWTPPAAVESKPR